MNGIGESFSLLWLAPPNLHSFGNVFFFLNMGMEYRCSCADVTTANQRLGLGCDNDCVKSNLIFVDLSSYSFYQNMCGREA